MCLAWGGGQMCNVCRLFARTSKARGALRFAPCRGSIASRSHATHDLRYSCGVTWCYSCAAYATARPQCLKFPCPRGPPSKTRADIKKRLRRGLLPTSAAYLDFVSEQVDDAPEDALFVAELVAETVCRFVACASQRDLVQAMVPESHNRIDEPLMFAPISPGVARGGASRSPPTAAVGESSVLLPRSQPRVKGRRVVSFQPHLVTNGYARLPPVNPGGHVIANQSPRTPGISIDDADVRLARLARRLRSTDGRDVRLPKLRLRGKQSPHPCSNWHYPQWHWTKRIRLDGRGSMQCLACLTLCRTHCIFCDQRLCIQCARGGVSCVSGFAALPL